ncbi:amino acid/amide ABC transporter ATP-binding protein 2 (HAAT family) [Delftia sp. 60]|nr:amino acid/amide ABC transporter ATP-binding protein 2 (HAAT family) [Delftia sp. 60]
MLEMQAVQSGYGPSQVLFGVDLRIEAGQVVTLLGRNGMGKTTLLRTLLGQLPLRAGRMVFAGQDIAGWATDRIARAGVAIVPEGRQCFPNLTVREHLTAFVAQRNSGSPGAAEPWTPERVFALFPRLRERASNMGNQLSGGEQQMLAIGRALVTNPRLLILDEATEGLAPRIREEIWACLAQLRAAGQTILVIDKYVERLLGLADRHLILERGKVVWSGDSAALDGTERCGNGIWECEHAQCIRSSRRNSRRDGGLNGIEDQWVACHSNTCLYPRWAIAYIYRMYLALHLIALWPSACL